tara:strand:+ start:1124 stop:2110 length:987 start_codon:yes stop_codon:yes gene_type:complete
MAIIGTKNEQGAYPVMAFQESQTWACPVAMEAIVYVIGAGGSGASIRYSYHDTRNATGGGAGGCAVSRLSLAAQNYTITIGSGGDDKASNYADGDDGGDSSFSGSGITTMTGSGGSGGTTGTSAQTGAAGGGASGGNLMNNTGGAAGTNTSATDRVSGGGGVNLYGSGVAGEGEQSDHAYGGTPQGMSVEGHRDTNILSTYNGFHKNTGIALSFFPNTITHTSGFWDEGNPTDTGNGGIGTVPAQIYSGHAHYRSAYVYNNRNALTQFAGPFCGGQGYRNSAGSTNVYAQSGGVGAGGGACMNNGNSGHGYSGCGGSGLILIFPIQLG